MEMVTKSDKWKGCFALRSLRIYPGIFGVISGVVFAFRLSILEDGTGGLSK